MKSGFPNFQFLKEYYHFGTELVNFGTWEANRAFLGLFLDIGPDRDKVPKSEPFCIHCLLSTRKEQIRREEFGTSQFENYHWPVTWPRFVLLQLFQAYGDLFLCLGSRVAELRDEICPKFWQISRRRRPRTKGKKTPEKGRGMGIADGAPSRPPLHNVIIRELRIQNVCQQKVQMAQSKKKGRGSSWSYLCTALVVIIIWSKSVRKFKLVKND